MILDDIDNISKLFYIQGDLISQYREFDYDANSLKSCTITYSSKEEIINEFQFNSIKITEIFSNMNFVSLYERENINNRIIYMAEAYLYMNTIFNIGNNDLFNDDLCKIKEQTDIFNQKTVKFNYIDFKTAIKIAIEKLIKLADELLES